MAPRRPSAPLRPGLRRLARRLRELLLGEAERHGIFLRSDGYGRLDELLSLDCMQEVVEAVAPGSAADLNTGGYGGPVSGPLRAAVHELVASLPSAFDFWDPEADELWLRTDAEAELPAEGAELGQGAPSPPLHALALALHDLLGRAAAEEGLPQRSDGFSRLDEVLAMPCVREALDGAAPGSAASLHAGSWDAPAPVPERALAAVRAVVSSAPSSFEFWDPDADPLWIRARGDPPERPRAPEAQGAGSPPAAQPAAQPAVAPAALAAAPASRSAPLPSWVRQQPRPPSRSTGSVAAGRDQPEVTREDLLRLLPQDAPREVREYMEALVTQEWPKSW